MSLCDELQAALVDETVLRPTGWESHLETCDACRGVSSAHRSALRLRGVALPTVPNRPRAEVKRRAGIVAGLSLAVVGAVGWYQLESNAPPAEAVAGSTPMPEQVVQRVVPEVDVSADESEFLALSALFHSTAAEVARDPRHDEVADRVFGELPKWTAPHRTRPMRGLAIALSPVVFTQEDAP